jgi:hypothetical protein
MSNAGFDRDFWRLECFDAIAAFADRPLQEMAWRASTSNPHWSFYEFKEKWHSDFLNGLEPWLANGGLTRAEADILIDLQEALAAYRPPCEDPYDVEAVLADPRWAIVVAQARRTRDRLLAQPISADERAALKGRLSWEQFQRDAVASTGSRH